MRILLDARLYGLAHAGLGRYTINLIKELQSVDKKNKYVVLLRKDYFNRLKFPENWKKVLADFKHYTVTEQIKLPSIIGREKPDVVHFLSSYGAIFYQGKFIVTIHDLLMQTHRGAKATTLPFYLYYPKHIGAKIVFRQTVRAASKVITPSRSVKKEIENYYKVDPAKIRVIYEGVSKNAVLINDSRKVLRKYGIDREYFIYTGNAYPHKNLERAIKAVVGLNKNGQRALFVIASSRGVFTQRLNKLVKELGAGKDVKLLGFVPDGDLGVLYANSSAFLFPSLSEGFGLPGLEAMAEGTVVLASDIPVFREVYKDVPVYFDPYDIESIKKGMEKVVKMSRGERNKIIEKGRKLVKKYSWSKMARETLSLYEDCARLRSG